MNMSDEIGWLGPEQVLATLGEATERFGFGTGDAEDVQRVDGRITQRGGGRVVYEFTRVYSGTLVKVFEVVLNLRGAGEGTAVGVEGRLLRAESPPGTVIEADDDAEHDVRGFWGYLKNALFQAAMIGRIDEIQRTYNAGSRELEQVLRDPRRFAPAAYAVTEQEDALVFRDPTGSLAYALRRLDDEPGRIVYHLQSSTSDMWLRSGVIEMILEKQDEIRTRLTLRGTAGPTSLSQQMRMSAMYLPAEQLAGYLSFRQDLGALAEWISGAVLLQIPHIRDLITVQGDFVAGGKVEIHDSVVSHTDIRAGAGAGGPLIVHADNQVGEKIEIRDSVVASADIGGRARFLEAYAGAVRAALVDGRIEPSEEAMLEAMRQGLQITPQEHLAALEGAGVLASAEVRQYRHILETSLADGKIDASEAALLEAIQKQLGIPRMVHEALLAGLARPS